MTVQYKPYDPTLAVMARTVVHSRAEIRERLQGLARAVPAEQVAGPPFCIFHFITSEVNGSDVTLGMPVTAAVPAGPFESAWLPAVEVLSAIHRGEPEKLRETSSTLFSYANHHGLISDEFYREVYLDETHPGGPGIEVQFVIHNWQEKLAAGLERVLGAEARRTLMPGSADLGIESGVAARFQWAKEILERLDRVASQEQVYEILSGCAHVFPQGQVDKLAGVYAATRASTGDPLAAVDAVIRFMDQDPGWVEGGRREGYTIYAAKLPRDRQAYDAAQTGLERRQAYCFCPVLRTQLDQGMPPSYCCCGAGWFRQQWEGAIGRPLKIDIVRSVLRGDDACEFAIHLPLDA